MKSNSQSGHSRLDSIRLTEGPDRCKAVFNEVCKRDKSLAAALINDRRLSFGCFFILLELIESFSLYSRLSPVKKTEALITAQILKRGPSAGSGYLWGKNSAEYSALKWIFESGRLEDGLSDDYEEVLDICVSVLINTYKDKSILPAVSDMIFMRAGKGRNIHDLIWAFFRSGDPYALKLIAHRISFPRDSALACTLLNIKTASGSADAEKRGFLQWLDDNDAFLYFTDESFQLTGSPEFYRIDLERKYIQKTASSYLKQPIIPADSHENRCLEAFRSLRNEEKQVLSEYSHALHSNLPKWKMWMALPVDQQIKAATHNLEEV